MKFKIYFLCLVFFFQADFGKAQCTNCSSFRDHFNAVLVGGIVVVGVVSMVGVGIKQGKDRSTQRTTQAKMQRAAIPQNLKSIRIIIPEGTYLGLQEKITFQLEETYIFENKSYVRSTGETSFKEAAWEAFAIELQGGTLLSNHQILVNKNFEGCEQGKLKIRVKSKRDTSLVVEEYITFAIASQQRLGFAGQDGSHGNAGADGEDAELSSDQENCLREAQIGKPGSDGSVGQSGPRVDVYIKKVFNENVGKDLLYFRVENTQTGESKLIVVDTSTTVVLFANGGNGGDGGSGGSGGDAVCSDSKNDQTVCYAASGGKGGDGGNGGNSGNLFIHLDTSVTLASLRLVYEQEPGKGGRMGARGAWGTGATPLFSINNLFESSEDGTSGSNIKQTPTINETVLSLEQIVR